MSDLDICVDQIREALPGVLGVWVFGSTASNQDLNSSDIDLAFLSTEGTDNVRVWDCAQRIASRMNRDVDLIDLLSASTVMRAQILQEGRRIYCADEFKCNLFETEALADYLRFNEERKDLLEDIRTRGKVF